MISIRVPSGPFEQFVYLQSVGTLRAYRRDGTLTICDGVPHRVVERLSKAAAPGRYFATRIAKQYASWHGFAEPGRAQWVE